MLGSEAIAYGRSERKGLDAAFSASDNVSERRKAPLGRPVFDGEVSFDVFRFQCGSGRIGNEEATLEPDKIYCMVALGVLNGGSESVHLDPYSYFLIADSAYRPWREAMERLVIDDANNLFLRPIPPGGGGLETLYFQLPTGVRPSRLRLHTQPHSEGALLTLNRCRWSDSGGSCSTAPDRGERGNAYPRDPSIELAYPHSMEIDQPTCFDEREWMGTYAPAVPSNSAGFWGQGTIALKHEQVAEFYDNFGGTILLTPTLRNLEDPRICG